MEAAILVVVYSVSRLSQSLNIIPRNKLIEASEKYTLIGTSSALTSERLKTDF